MRVEQPEGARGSLKWIQRLVRDHPTALDEPLRSADALSSGRRLRWLSPLPNDDWAEYRDTQWLDTIGHPQLSEALKEFWPRRGPQWDALAQDDAGRLFLFEAKAHRAEMGSTCQAGTDSKRRIAIALDATKKQLGAKPDSDWLSGYYQYANRLAHLGFLQKRSVDAWMVFLYFVGDADMRGPASEADWKPHIELAHQHLGLRSHTPGVVSLFLPVSGL